MKKVNKTRYAILGMLFDQPRSGYEIKKRMLTSTAHFWNETDASIYPMLKTLEREDKVRSKTEFTGKRSRTVFEITEIGKQEFTAWMPMPADHEHPRSELLLKLFFGALTSKDNILKQLQLQQSHCQETQKMFEAIAKGLKTVDDTNPHKLFWHLSLRNGILFTQTKLRWIDECLTLLKNQ